MSSAELPSQGHEHYDELGNSFSIEDFHQDPALFERLSPRQQHAAFEMMRLGHLRASSDLVEASDELFKTQEENESLRQKVNYDPLTGLLSQEGLKHELEARPTDPVSLLVIDVTNFKGPNDDFGHPAGDAILQDVSNILRNSVREGDLIARLNSAGDEFVVVAFDDTESSATTDAKQERRNDAANYRTTEIREAMRTRLTEYLEGAPELKAYNLNIAVGDVAWNPAGTEPLQSNIARADAALKQHKAEQHERGRYDRATRTMQ